MSADAPSPVQLNPLRQSTQFLKGVGPARFEQLKRLGLVTIEDLLWHLPRSYDNLANIKPMDQVVAGETQTVYGEVVEIEGRRLDDGRSVVSVVIGEGMHCVEGVWFNQANAARRYRYGQRLAFSGKPRWFRDRWQMNNPRVHTGEDGETAPEDVGIVPVYPLTEDLRADQLRRLIRQAIDGYAGHLTEILSPALRERHGWAGVADAVRHAHAPATIAEARRAKRRFVYEEFLVLQLALGLRRRDVRNRENAPVLPLTPLIDARIRRLFPFPLTADQDRAVADVCRDLASPRPMQRLVQADVGAGKTAVAAYALLVTVANKHQAALMAPTEVLARQHAATFEQYLAHSRVRRLLLTGGLGARDRQAALEAIAAGEVDLVIGTTALVQEDVRFARLGLVVIDEQHRFGVNQRARVRKLGANPHYLVMTATPIPRTVALTVFGDLDVSVIKQMPPGRKPVQTRWLPSQKRDEVHARVRAAVARGRQTYVVCPLVSESGASDMASAEQTYEQLKTGPFAGLRLGLLHGRQDDEVKGEAMTKFRAGEIDVLVCTSVVEVGVDVPNATVLVVEHADRFGLSQLHQLRGRVSRGDVAGECYLIADPAADETKQRLKLICRVSDGFRLAEEDARLRGLGEFFGTKQHGLGALRFGDLLADHELLRVAREDAFQLIVADPGLRRDEHAELRKAVLEKYGQSLDLAEIG